MLDNAVRNYSCVYKPQLAPNWPEELWPKTKQNKGNSNGGCKRLGRSEKVSNTNKLKGSISAHTVAKSGVLGSIT